MKPSRLVIPLLLLLCAYALRTYAVGKLALRGDEAFSLGMAAQPVSVLMDVAVGIDPNPPLYFLLLKGWLRLTGNSELAARWPSVLGGVVTVALIYRLGRAWATERAALWALGLAAFNPFLIWYGQDARAYSLWLAMILAAIWATWQAAQPHPVRPQRGRGCLGLAQRKIWWRAGALWWLAFMTHYMTVLPFLAVGLALLLAPRTRTQWLQATVMAMGVGLTFLPWAVYVAPFLAKHTKGWISPVSGLEILQRVLRVFSVGTSAAGGVGWLTWVGGGLLLLLLILGTIHLLRRDASVACWMLMLGGGVPLGLWLISLARPVFTEQYALPGLPGLLLIAAAGLELLDDRRAWGLWAGRLAFAGLGGVALLSLHNYFFNPAYAKSPDWHTVIQYLTETARPNEVVVLNLPDPGFYHYYHGPMPVVASPPDILAVAGIPATEAQLTQLRDTYYHIRFFFSPSLAYDPDGFVGYWLAQCCEKTSDEFVALFRVQTFDTPAGSLAARELYPVEFEAGIQLTGYRVVKTELNAGQSAGLTLFWKAQKPITTSYTIFVHLLAADGFNLADADGLPAYGRHPTNQWTINEDVIDPHPIQLASDMAPGEYALEIGVYDQTTGKRLMAVEPSGAVVDAVRLPLTLHIKAP